MRAGWEETLQRNERKPVCSSQAKDHDPRGYEIVQGKGWMEKWERCRRDASQQCSGQSSGTGVRGEGRREDRGGLS